MQAFSSPPAPLLAVPGLPPSPHPAPPRPGPPLSAAKVYETSTETLFLGRQDAMQRSTLVPLADFMRGKDASQLQALEVAAGTGRFATFVKVGGPGCCVLLVVPCRACFMQCCMARPTRRDLPTNGNGTLGAPYPTPTPTHPPTPSAWSPRLSCVDCRTTTRPCS